MKTIEDEFPPVDQMDSNLELFNAYTRLRARAAEMERALQWRPIEEAPRDGTEIDVWREDAGVIRARWTSLSEFLTDKEMEQYTLEYIDEPGWFFADFVSGGRLDDGDPTHFRPLPPAPEIHQTNK
jgi:hypothetical protein